MTWRFICAHTDWLASAAPAAAAGAANISDEVGCTFTGSDKPKGELDVLYMHGHQRRAGRLRERRRAARRGDRDVRGDDSKKSWRCGDGFTRTRYSNAAGTRFEFIEHDYATDAEVGVPPSRLGDRRPLLPRQPRPRDHRRRPADGVRLRAAERVHVERRSDGVLRSASAAVDQRSLLELDGRFGATGRPRASGAPCSRRGTVCTSVTLSAAASPPHLRATSLPRRSSCRIGRRGLRPVRACGLATRVLNARASANGSGFSCEAARPATVVRARAARADATLAMVAPTRRQRDTTPRAAVVARS